VGAAHAEAARAAQAATQSATGQVSGLAATLSSVDKNNGATIDLSTLLSAFDNYLNAIVKDDSVGAPIGFYVKRINAAQIAREWVESTERRQANAAAAASSPAPTTPAGSAKK